jgi:hypothetical protein
MSSASAHVRSALDALDERADRFIVRLLVPGRCSSNKTMRLSPGCGCGGTSKESFALTAAIEPWSTHLSCRSGRCVLAGRNRADDAPEESSADGDARRVYHGSPVMIRSTVPTTTATIVADGSD